MYQLTLTVLAIPAYVWGSLNHQERVEVKHRKELFIL